MNLIPHWDWALGLGGETFFPFPLQQMAWGADIFRMSDIKRSSWLEIEEKKCFPLYFKLKVQCLLTKLELHITTGILKYILATILYIVSGRTGTAKGGAKSH